MLPKPDIEAKVRFYMPEDIGHHYGYIVNGMQRKGFPFYFQDEYFDCWLLLFMIENDIVPGEWASVPIRFLFPDNIKPKLKVNDEFKLWEVGFVADGIIADIFKYDN